MADPKIPAPGDKYHFCLEREKLAKKIDDSKTRSTKALTIKRVYHQTQVPEGMAPTWCVTVEENDACYDAAWSEKAKAWVLGGANSGIRA